MRPPRPFPEGTLERLQQGLKEARNKAEFQRVQCLWLRAGWVQSQSTKWQRQPHRRGVALHPRGLRRRTMPVELPTIHQQPRIPHHRPASHRVIPKGRTLGAPRSGVALPGARGTRGCSSARQHSRNSGSLRNADFPGRTTRWDDLSFADQPPGMQKNACVRRNYSLFGQLNLGA